MVTYRAAVWTSDDKKVKICLTSPEEAHLGDDYLIAAAKAKAPWEKSDWCYTTAGVITVQEWQDLYPEMDNLVDRNMRIECSWCIREIDPGDPDEQTSHGMCDACLRRLAKRDAEVEKNGYVRESDFPIVVPCRAAEIEKAAVSLLGHWDDHGGIGPESPFDDLIEALRVAVKS